MTGAPDPFAAGFSSMGAQEMDLRALSELAMDFNLDFLELRTVAGTTRLPAYFAAHPEDLTGARTSVRVVSTDLWLAKASEEDVRYFLEYARLADTLGAPYVRVFGGGQQTASPEPEILDRAANTVRQCRREMRESGIRCEMLLETHSGFSSSAACELLSRRLDDPLFILWDSHHTWKLAGESPEESWRNIGPLVRHIHYKDSQSPHSNGQPYFYVLPGTGEFPSGDLFQLLRGQNYAGGLSLEWERLWHPELLPLREALAAFEGLLRTAR